jgi:hypothetical protein
MKLIACFVFILLSFFYYIKATKTSQGILSNQEIKEVLKCFGDLDLEEGCVICRYITQKICKKFYFFNFYIFLLDKVLDISAMCPDIVETKLLNQREREWRPDPQVINKWTILYNLQKDYMERILPQIEATKKYDDVMHQKIIKEKAEKENLANLIQFQNKVNSDLQKSQKRQITKFDSDKSDGDESLHYKHLQVVGPSKPSLTDFNKLLMTNMKKNQINSNSGKPQLDPTHKSILMKTMKNFLNKKSGFNFRQIPIKDNQELASEKLPRPKMINEDLINFNINDPAVKSSFDFEKIASGIKLNNGEKVEYLGTSIGSPYAGINQDQIKQKIEKMTENDGKPVIKKVNFYSENKQTQEHLKKIEKSEESKTVRMNKDEQIIKSPHNSHIEEKKHEMKSFPNSINKNLSINQIPTKNHIKNNIQKNRQDSHINEKKLNKQEIEPITIFTQKSEVEKSNFKNLYNIINQKNNVRNNQPSFNLNFHKSKFDTSSEPIFDSQSDLMVVENNKILNPPPISFLETNEIISFDKNLFNSLISKSNFNLGLGIGDWGLGIGPNPQSPIPNPQLFTIRSKKQLGGQNQGRQSIILL